MPPECAASNPAIALRLQFMLFVRGVAELGAFDLGHPAQDGIM
jgi:hypothetical protein